MITPSMAQYLLDHNACIKPLNHQAVTKLVHELKGKFDFNGATIVLNSDHRLVDGRARLTACVESGISFKAFIVTGIGKVLNIQRILADPQCSTVSWFQWV